MKTCRSFPYRNTPEGSVFHLHKENENRGAQGANKEVGLKSTKHRLLTRELSNEPNRIEIGQEDGALTESEN